MHLKNKSNEYVEQLGTSFFTACPKTVLAAIAVSALTVGGDCLDEAEERVLREWWALYIAGIVPQKPHMPKPEEKEGEWSRAQRVPR